MQKTRLDGGFFDRTPNRDMTPYLLMDKKLQNFKNGLNIEIDRRVKIVYIGIS
jgi:hypothetical protein